MATEHHRITIIGVCVETNLRIFVQVKQTYWLYGKKNNYPKRIRFVLTHCGGGRTMFHRNPRILFPILHGSQDKVRSCTRLYFIRNFIMLYIFRGCAWVFPLFFWEKRHLKRYLPTDVGSIFLPIRLIVHASVRRCVTFSDLWPPPSKSELFR